MTSRIGMRAGGAATGRGIERLRAVFADLPEAATSSRARLQTVERTVQRPVAMNAVTDLLPEAAEVERFLATVRAT